MNDIFCLFHHLGFCNPQCSLGNCNSKIINLNSIKLINRNMNRGRFIKAKSNLSSLQFFYDFILQSPDTDICLCKEVSTSRCRIKPPEICQLRLEISQLFIFCSLNGYLLNFFQLIFQFVQKQRINDFMNIFNAGVVHTAGASCLWIQRTLKHSTKYSRTDF